MKIIFSQWSDTTAKHLSHRKKSFLLQMAAISNFLIKRSNFETVFWGDYESLKDFSNIEYDFFEELPLKELKKLPKCMWSLGKLLAINQMNEPCIHVDFDMFFFNNLEYESINKNIICLHDEPYFDHLMGMLQNSFGIQPQKCKGFNLRSYNCGIIGGSNISFLKKCISEITEYVYNNRQYINYISNTVLRASKGNLVPPCLVEQVWLFQLFKYYNQNIDIMFQGYNCFYNSRLSLYDKGACHLQSLKSNSVEIPNSIDNFIKLYNIKY